MKRIIHRTPGGAWVEFSETPQERRERQRQAALQARTQLGLDDDQLRALRKALRKAR